MNNESQEPDDIRRKIWKALGRASRDRHHAWRYPVLATLGADGAANARTVVLRDVDVTHQTLSIYTDARSPKAGELVKDSNAMFVFWSARLSWQLRVRVSTHIDTDNPKALALWQQVQHSAAAADYLRAAAPGSPYIGPQNDDAAADGVNHFALVSATVLEIDWLELGRSGHRRARLLPAAWQWLTP
jgi:hypothetical protein